MAVEGKRGCGFRKIGGLYMVGEYVSVPCDRLPFILDVCPCCGGGVKQTRGTTWIQPLDLFEGDHPTRRYWHNPETGKDELMASYGCECLTKNPNCPLCFPSEVFKYFEDDGVTEVLHGKALLLWIGAQHYPTPQDFMKEGIQMGFSRRVTSIPRGFKLGKTWVFMAHPKAALDNGNDNARALDDKDPEYKAGIITAFIPQRFERIVKQSEYDMWKLVEEIDEGYKHDITMEDLSEKCLAVHKKLQSDVDRCITLVPVPDDDPDHQ